MRPLRHGFANCQSIELMYARARAISPLLGFGNVFFGSRCMIDPLPLVCCVQQIAIIFASFVEDDGKERIACGWRLTAAIISAYDG
jgi:hypothetical protein